MQQGLTDDLYQKVSRYYEVDEFTPRATAYATEGVSAAAQANRARLREAMAAGGLSVYSGEWWHFDTDDAYDKRPILDVPVN